MKPILFSTEMVRAILEGRKTATRRPVPLKKVQDVLSSPARKEMPETPDRKFVELLIMQPWEVDDILYVRETWSFFAAVLGKASAAIVYKADCTDRELEELRKRRFRWHPSIHMPKKAARLFLRVTDVRVERLRDITEQEAKQEGFFDRQHFIDAMHAQYPEYGEDFWVWAVKFERTEEQNG